MIPLGSLLGAPLRMHFAFPVLLAAGLLLCGADVVFSALGALLLHEAGHVLAARVCGARLTRVELTPFGGVADYDGVGLSPAREALTALGGPLASLAGLALGRRAPAFAAMNAALLAVNLLPALPLDGGRALRAALYPRLGRARSTRILAGVGEAAGAALTGLGVYAAAKGHVNPSLFLCGAYLFYQAMREKETPALLFARALHGRGERLARAGTLPVKWLAAAEGTTPAQIAGRLPEGAYCMVALLDGEMRVKETVSETEVLRRCLKQD